VDLFFGFEFGEEGFGFGEFGVVHHFVVEEDGVLFRLQGELEDARLMPRVVGVVPGLPVKRRSPLACRGGGRG